MRLVVAAVEAQTGQRIPKVYARVQAGPNIFNTASLRSQESMTGEGPIAVVKENKSPYDEPYRYVAIFETSVDDYISEEGGRLVVAGVGADQYRDRYLGVVTARPNSPLPWLGPGWPDWFGPSDPSAPSSTPPSTPSGPPSLTEYRSRYADLLNVKKNGPGSPSS
jgi:hypothetical protein